MKKLICLAIAVIMLFSCCWVSASAEPAAAADTEPAVTVSKGGLVDYDSYLAENSAFADAADEIVITGDSYISANGAEVEKIETEDYKNAVKWTNGAGSITYKINVKNAALYSLHMFYEAIGGRSNAITIGIKIDGRYLFSGIDSVELPRVWTDGGEIREDGVGNQFTAEQVEKIMYTDVYVTDASGLVTEPYCIALSQGEHTVEIVALEESFILAKMVFGKPEKYEDYAAVSAGYAEKGYKKYEGDKVIMIEGEDAVYKSNNSLVAKSDSSDPSVSPSNPVKSLINYIGSTNWSSPGDRITWEFDVEQAGLYKLGIKFRQSGVLNGNSYRKIYIDGVVPFTEASNVAFAYDSHWQYEELCLTDENGKAGDALLFYLDKGRHTITMEVSIGELAPLARALENVVYSAGELYRKIVQITGETPDSSRDYDLFEQIPRFEETLEADMNELNRISYALEDLYGKTGGTNATTIRSLSQVMKNMLKFPYTAHQYVGLYYTNYCSVSALVYEMMSLPLDLDYMVFAAGDKTVANTAATFWEKSDFSFRRFLASFSSKYNSISGDIDTDEQITIWVNWGRDQVRVLNDLIKSSFTPQTGIGVNVKISNASYIQAILSGNSPDCCLHMARTEPVNLALRGAMVDLKQFPDYEQVIEKTYSSGGKFDAASAVVPYTFEGGVYALPDTRVFSMLFYRTDVFEELGIKPPATWEEFLHVSSIIMRSNYDVGMPYDATTSSIYQTFLLQKNERLYTEKLDALNLTSATAMERFEWWTKLYTEYKFPLTYNFFNRFRLGTMPMGIVGYTYYIQLSVAAPEVAEKWQMVPVPGTVSEDGSVNNLQAGTGTGAGILKVSKNQKGGWEFLKWWVSADTQLRYSNNCESILGVAGRVATANPDALAQMAWDKNSLNNLMSQWKNLREVEEVAGGYYTSRIIDQAFWNVVNNGKNAKDMVIKWTGYGNAEIARKRGQYNLD